MKKKQFVAVAMAVSLSATSVIPAMAADTSTAMGQETTDAIEKSEETSIVESTDEDSESTESTEVTTDAIEEQKEVSDQQDMSEIQSETAGVQTETPTEQSETTDNTSPRLFSLYSANSKAIGEYFEPEYVKYRVTGENEVYVAGYNSNLVLLPEEERNVTVPSTVDWEGVTYNVKGIVAESGSKWIETIVIEEGVTDIHYTAFDSMANLKSLEIKDPNANLKSEDNIVFTQDGTEIVFYTPYKTETTYTIPDTVTCVNASFAGVQYLKEIIVPDSVTKIAEGCLSHMTSVEKLTMSENTAELGQSAIRGNENLKELIVQGEFRTGFYCFSDMPNLEKNNY